MKIINNKYTKIFFVFLCTFLICDKVLAADAKAGFDFAGTDVICAGEKIPYGFPYIVSNIINLFKIITPIVLIIFGMIDFGKAVVASDEKQMKEGSSKFIRRTIAAVIVFFVIAIVQFAFGVIGEDSNGVAGCFDCFVNGKCNK